MKERRILLVTEIIIAALLSFLLIRLLKGPWISGNIVFHRFTWLLLAPVMGLRHISTTVVIIIGYILVWIYIAWCKSSIIRDRHTFILAGFWALVGVLAFIPAGFEVFSLVAFSARHISILIMMVCYTVLISAYFLIFRYYFKQKIWLSAWWTIIVILAINIMNTFFNLLPQLASEPFLHSLNYSSFCLINILNAYPVLGWIIGAALCWSGLRYLRYRFIAVQKRHRRAPWPAPLVLTCILVIIFNVLYNDLLRYRKFNYRQGINTVYLSKLEDRIITWCNNRHFGFVLNSAKLVYPFTMQPLSDSLHNHGRRLSRLTFIEGMDFFRYERILKVLAYGNRDTVLYDKIKPLLRRTYYNPVAARLVIDDINARYVRHDADIAVKGYVAINGNALAICQYLVAFFNGGTSLPVWMARTDANGCFSFNCHSPDSDEYYVTVHFLLPDSILHGHINSVEIVNMLPVITRPGDYQLDTFRMNIIKDAGEIKIHEMHIYARSALGGCRFFLPENHSVPIRISGRTSDRGILQDIKYFSFGSDTVGDLRDLKRSVATWRFYSPGAQENLIEVFLNANCQ